MTKPVELDLDAAKAAVEDAEKAPLPVRLGGEIFHAIRPLRLSVAVAVAEGNVPAAVRGLFGEQAKDVLEAGLDMADLKLVVEALIDGAGEDGPGNGSSG